MNVLPNGYYDEQERPMGLFLNFPEDKYFAVRAFSFSGSKAFKRSPRHFKAYLQKEFEIDPVREKYKVVHALCLPQENAPKIEVVDGRWDGEKKKKAYELKSQGFLVVKQDALDEAKAIQKCVATHSLAGAILANSLCEVSLFWIQDGVYCKCRIDILSITEHGICLGDLKNYGNLASEYDIGRQIGEQKYNWQMAFYSKGIEAVFGQTPIKRYWIFVEDKSDDGEHHGVKVRNCPDPLVEAGWASINELLPIYKNCLETNVWPSYDEEEQDAGMPDRYFPGVSNE